MSFAGLRDECIVCFFFIESSQFVFFGSCDVGAAFKPAEQDACGEMETANPLPLYFMYKLWLQGETEATQ